MTQADKSPQNTEAAPVRAALTRRKALGLALTLALGISLSALVGCGGNNDNAADLPGPTSFVTTPTNPAPVVPSPIPPVTNPAPMDGTLLFSSITGNVTGTGFTPTGVRVNSSPNIVDANGNRIPLTLLTLASEATTDGAAELTRTVSLVLPPNLAAGDVVNLRDVDTAGRRYSVSLRESRLLPGSTRATNRIFGAGAGSANLINSGTITVVSVPGATNSVYTLTLSGIRLGGIAGSNSDATGAFVVNGSVTVPVVTGEE